MKMLISLNAPGRMGFARKPVPKSTITVNGIPLSYKIVGARKPSTSEAGVWTLILTNTKERVTITFNDFFTYSGGYSQGMGRSSYQWFQSNKLFGGGTNGSGQDRQTTPSMGSSLVKSLTEMLNDPKDYHWDQGQYYVHISDPDDKLGLSSVAD